MLGCLQWCQNRFMKGVALAFTVGEVVFQAKADTAKCKIVPWDFVGGDQPYFEALFSCQNLGGTQLSAIEEVDLIDVGNIDHGEWCIYRDISSRFLSGFTAGGLDRGFAVFHEAARKCPVAMARFDGASAHQDTALPFSYAADDEARVFIMDVAASAADVSWKTVADGYGERDAGAASNTKLNHNNPRAFHS